MPGSRCNARSGWHRVPITADSAHGKTVRIRRRRATVRREVHRVQATAAKGSSRGVAVGRPHLSCAAKPGDRRSPQPARPKTISAGGTTFTSRARGRGGQMRAWAVSGLLAVLLLGFSSVSHCQSTPSGTATFSGTLSDPSGAVISGGQVSISTLNAVSSRRELLHVLSGNDGRYTATVPAGHCCVLRVTHPSFVTREETVRVAPGESRTVDFLLQINPLASTIVVTAQAEPASADSTPAPVTVLTREDFERRQANSLPDLLATQPGISTVTKGGLATIFIDGGNSNFTKLLV